MYYRYAMLDTVAAADAEEQGESERYLRLCFSQPSVEALHGVGERLAAACAEAVADAEAEAEAEEPATATLLSRL